MQLSQKASTAYCRGLHPRKTGSTCALGHPLAEQQAVLETPSRAQIIHKIHTCVWPAVDGCSHTVAVTAGCTTRTGRGSQLQATPFLRGDPLPRPDRRHHCCRTPGQPRQFGLEVCQSEFHCHRSREISADAYWGLGKSLRTHPPGVGHPSKPRVLARSENPPSE